MLMKAHKDIIDIGHLESHFRELAKYDISENRVLGYLENFINLLRKEKLYG
jgi:hypothetical protein